MQRLGRTLGNLLAIALTVLSLNAWAETLTGGRNFNHDSTGFQLNGGHATAACETCHIGGTFRGTPRACDGCHTLGKRIVATPKSTSHLVTDAPCETCHFTTSTFLGARFNHGTVKPGTCVSCHNKLTTAGRPASHSTGSKATASCDNCHRTYAWLPASWNHQGVLPGTCDNAGCHVQGSNQYYRSTATHTLTLMRANKCDDCHNFLSWTPTHIAPTKLCSGCHNDIDAKGILAFKPGPHVPVPATTNCTDCHASTTTASSSWIGGKYNHQAAGVTPGSCSNAGCHIAGANRFTAQSHKYSPQNFTLMMTTPACDSCHSGYITFMTPTHIAVMGTCSSCHDNVKAKGPASYPGHVAVNGDCQGCHTSTVANQSSTWAGAIGAEPSWHSNFSNHTCSNCHLTGGAFAPSATIHSYVAAPTCVTCHATGSNITLKTLTIQQRTIGSHEGSRAGQDCISCHARQYTVWNKP